jgi:hypothetical protein
LKFVCDVLNLVAVVSTSVSLLALTGEQKTNGWPSLSSLEDLKQERRKNKLLSVALFEKISSWKFRVIIDVS